MATMAVLPVLSAGVSGWSAATGGECSARKVPTAALCALPQSSFVGCKIAVPTVAVASSCERRFRATCAVESAASGLTAAPSKQKIRIKLRSYWTPLIEQACQQILDAAKNTNALTMGPVPLPTKKRVYCVLRAPHVNKDSREHFEIRTHRRLIDLANPTAQTIDALMQLDLPAGVDVEVKLT